MLPSSPDRMPRARAERTMIARVVLAVGLALLLVVGAWSTSRGSAEVHATLCLASGITASAGTESGTAVADGATAVDVLTADAGVCLVVALCCVALVLLFLRLRGRGTRLLVSRAPRTAPPARAGPRPLLSALSLTELSISRT
ncbi:hypothetical protein [Microbacterium sp. J1-1]|uniref:hypothetical protein n=1 Tax=Microbacterium sp. J1-1 TaxID=2992441 RepID=UPI00211520A8|nr:hypothetical protein [Microbacterium sp. J1-1]UUE19908.1 hypothetical protein LRQ07_14080 [Microbacterium sp. J1-1]